MCSRCRHERADLLDREVLFRPVHVVVERPLWRIRAGVADGADGGPGPAAHRAASAEAGCAMSYEPHPSTVAYRAIEILKRLPPGRSEEHTSELQSLMRISYAVFCLKKKK